MCEVCNETLSIAASAAKDLANAASALYHINQSAEAAVLAKAAAALFEEPKVDPAKPNAGSGEAQTAEESVLDRARRELNEKLPEGIYVTQEGLIVNVNGTVIGKAVLVRR